MNGLRTIRIAASILALSSIACADRTSRTALTRPQVGRHAVSGQVRVAGRLHGAHGDSVGTRSLDSASGVRVMLRRPDASIDSVLTNDGRFEFRVDAPGLYRVSSYACPEIVSAADIEVVDADAVLPETLAVVPSGLLTTYPNPFPTTGGLAIEFMVPAAAHVEVSILTLAGAAVWNYPIDLPAGFQHFHWGGVDDAGSPLPSGAYWCVVKMGDVHVYNLVFKE